MSVAAVVLAAGESTRMGELKALLPWGSTTLLGHAVASVVDAGYASVVVVLGHEEKRLRPEVPGGALIIVNERYREGRATSIVAGVEALIGQQPGVGGGEWQFDGLLLTSVDQPRSVAMLRQLRQAWEGAQHRSLIGGPSSGGKVGHPALFHASLVDELLAVTEESQGLRGVVARHRAARLLVPTDDPLVLTNINTSDDYEQALKLA